MDTYLTILDELGELRPLAGIWNDDQYGKQSANKFISKNPDCKIVKVSLQLRA